MYGEVPPRLAIPVTAAIPFSSQSVMTLAKADGAAPIITRANNPLQRLECMLRSSGVGNPCWRISSCHCRGQRLRYMTLRDHQPVRVTDGVGGQPIMSYGLSSLGQATVERSFGATTEVPFGR